MLTTVDLSRLYRWSAADLSIENISRRFAEVWFPDLYGDFGRQGCPQILVILYWLGWLALPSRFLMITRLQN
jgi:hypothetical protein